MTRSVVFEDKTEILFSRSLAEFRAWAASDGFLTSGRVDYLAGRTEVDMSAEDLSSHGALKAEIVRTFQRLVNRGARGYLFTDRARASFPDADLSAQPDAAFVSEESLESGRVRLVPNASRERDCCIELEGPPDVIVEIVSDSSETKDTQRLPAAYFRAGVPEFWLIDARGEELFFQIHRPGPSAYEPTPRDAEGYQQSAAFGSSFRFTRRRNERGRWTYELTTR